LLIEDAADGASVEAAVVMGAARGGTKGLLTVGLAQTDERADVDGRKGLHACLEAVDEGSEIGEATEEGLVEALAAVGATVTRPAVRQAGVVGGVDDEAALVRVGDVGAGKRDGVDHASWSRRAFPGLNPTDRAKFGA
jgi:hypothetical protein